MKTILDTIIEHKKMEILKRKARKSLEVLMQTDLYKREALDPHPRFFESSGPCVIAEFKRKSPSKGMMNDYSDPTAVVKAYERGGACMSSILTDRNFFGGSFKDLQNVREAVPNLPLLRKDFMIDPYQVHEAKAYGADVILLIAAILEKEEVSSLSTLAQSLGLSVLLEVHSEEELEKWNPDIRMVGVNNRSLKDFSVSIQLSLDLSEKLPGEVVKVSESGLKNVEDIKCLYESGYKAFLIGERFMTEENPGAALSSFINKLR